MSLIAIKLIFLAAILFSGWLGGVLPIRRGTVEPASRVLSWGNAFAAGIFFGIGMIHMLPEANDSWMELGWEYPMAFALAGMAFLLFFLFEHVVLPDSAHAAVHAHAHPGDDVLAHEGHDHSPALYPYALVVALSIHSVVAGIALGAQHTIANAAFIFVAIVTHKSTAGFALGVSLARAELPAIRAKRLIWLFAVMTPLGILLGMAISGLLQSRGGLLFDAAFTALAAGTFLYIASLDILQDEFLRPGSRWAKWLFAALAVGLMALLALWL